MTSTSLTTKFYALNNFKNIVDRSSILFISFRNLPWNEISSQRAILFIKSLRKPCDDSYKIGLRYRLCYVIVYLYLHSVKMLGRLSIKAHNRSNVKKKLLYISRLFRIKIIRSVRNLCSQNVHVVTGRYRLIIFFRRGRRQNITSMNWITVIPSQCNFWPERSKKFVQRRLASRNFVQRFVSGTKDLSREIA